MDSKSIGLWPQGFESPRCRIGKIVGKLHSGIYACALLSTYKHLKNSLPTDAAISMINFLVQRATAMATMYSTTRPLMLLTI